MSSHWRSDLRRALLGILSGKRLVIVGVGNDLRGDDGVGSVLARRLAQRGVAGAVDAGAVPENHCERVAELDPELVLVIDAARFGGRPGEARLLTRREIAGKGLSTHDSSLALFSGYLTTRCACEILFLGIEPASRAMGGALSPAVRETMEWIEELLAGQGEG